MPPPQPPSCTSLGLSSSTCKIKNGLQDLRGLKGQHSINLPDSTKEYTTAWMAEQKHGPLWKTPRDPRMVGTNWLIDGLKFLP